jgi:hypothetical protein
MIAGVIDTSLRRASGSLFGLAYGDALGKPTEFLTVAEIERRYGPAGPRELSGEPALVTDDTQMALAVGWALRQSPTLTPEAVEPLLRERFVEWSVSPENNRAPGMTCLRACAELARGVRWQEATVAGSKGCGANMRVTPIGLLDVDLDTLAGLAQLQAGLTHGHPTGLAASELTAYAVRLLRDGAMLAEVPGLLTERAHQQRLVYRSDWLGDLWQRPGVASPEEFVARGWDECLAVLDRLTTTLAGPDDGGDPCWHTGEGGWPRRRSPPRCSARSGTPTTRCGRWPGARPPPATPTPSPRWPARSSAPPTGWRPGRASGPPASSTPTSSPPSAPPGTEPADGRGSEA